MEDSEVFKTDELGFVEERCPHCGARFYFPEKAQRAGNRKLCLNGCFLPGYLYRKLMQIPTYHYTVEKARD